MASKALRLAAMLVLAASQTAIGEHAWARGGGGGVSSRGHSGHMGHFNRPFVRNHFLRNRAVLGGWGWGWPYGDEGYSNTTVVFPQATPQAANVTGTIATPCHWNEDTFSVPSATGGTRPVQVVTCR